MTSIDATSERTVGTIDRALNVLREAAAAKDKVQTRGVALALWVLRGHCPAEWLVAFWDAAGSDHAIGRSQGLHAAYNGIVRQVRTSGGLSKESCDDRLSR
ncbi:hypothetical protein [Sphingomonas sp.]|jgi:hypothetical protein|uniref:hypothetical protein n=1 Tax=Sphingomonas sp. TaxID=28214 RepID=UPI00257AF244|nr:hypothetical protein [Sphingomonas sp.]